MKNRSGNLCLTISLVLIVTLFCLPALAEHYSWDCPECGRTGNTGNYCGSCAHPAPWIEQEEADLNGEPNVVETETDNSPELPGNEKYENSLDSQENGEKPNDLTTTDQSDTSIGVGDYIIFGHYEQDNYLSNGAEEIEWLVLELQGNQALVISRFGLDDQLYNAEDTDITWEKSSLRHWLNDDFLNTAFSFEEKKAIVQTDVDNGIKQGLYNTKGGNNTSDQVFLLSYSQLMQYLPGDSERICQPTAFAESQGAYSNRNGNGWWWLRSPGEEQNTVIRAGDITPISYTETNNSAGCVRPSIWINLDADLAQKTTITEERFDLAWNYVRFGHYEQDNNLNGSEEIEWIVLEVKDNKVLLISKYGLDAKSFNSRANNITWGKSTLRRWLNDDFVNTAFTSEERKYIIKSSVSNDSSQGNNAWKTSGGSNTKDMVFLLSYAETEKYFKDAISKCCKPTPYAEAQGAYVNPGNGNGWWWLRSPGATQKQAAYVRTIGTCGSYTNIVDVSGCIRPAIWVSLDSGIM